MHRDGTRILSSALLALTGWLQTDALAQSETAEKFLTHWTGNLPIVVIAPHGGREAVPGIQSRQGQGVRQFKPGRDSNTAELAEAIAIKLSEKLGAKPFLIVAHFDRKYIDANRPSDQAYEAAQARPYYTAFHRAIELTCKQIRRVWGRGLLLDIHGQAAEADVIFRGTSQGKSVADLLQNFGQQALTGPQSLLGQLAVRGYRIMPAGNEPESRYIGGHTMQTYGSHRITGIDAIQLEFGSQLRARDNLDKTAADLAAAIAVFTKQYLPNNQKSIRPTVQTQP
jgi:N-formylglutamate amidohydrolase